jgi:Tfp pilus assembly protein PilO
MKLPKQLPQNIPQQTLIAVGLAVGGLLIGMLGYFVAVSPEKAKIGGINSQIEVARSSLLAAEVPTAKTKVLPANAVDLFKLETAMPINDNVPGLVLELSALAKASALTVSGITPSADLAETGYAQVPISLQVVGTFPNVTTFVRKLRESVVVNGQTLKVNGRLFVPTSVAVTTAQGNSINATITLDAFVYGSGSTTTTTATTTTGTDSTTTGTTTTTSST